MTNKEKEEQKAEGIQWLKKYVKKGARVYTALKSVSSSGMSRRISCYIVTGKDIMDISHAVAQALELKRGKDGGLIVSGAGMDMGYWLVSEIAYAITDRKNYKTLSHSWL